jgi:tetratricopeptide (TPR) repeat protein
VNPRTISAIAALALLCLLVGCAGSSGRVTDYAEAYQQGRFKEAERAAALAANQPGEAGRRARLVEGLAAHARGDYVQAELRLEPLASVSEDDIAGPAAATLGLIAAERGQHERAADFLTKAADHLTGDDEVRARVHAAMAYEALGRGEQAALQRRLAMRDMGSPNRLGRSAYQDGSYAIQLGAFSSRARAAKMVEMSRKLARANGLGEPRITRSIGSGGETLYLVHIGRFGSLAQAERVQRGLGVASVIAGADVD